MALALDHWHIEVSSICTLKCPRCPRTEMPETLINRQLTLDFFRTRIGESRIKKIRKITFCGDDGDPIYAKDFLQIVEWIKDVNPTLQLLIITNGSYKNADWWHKLATLLNEHDEMHWSLDGWDQESNIKYRVNCDWKSIMLGLITFRVYNKITYTVVATIAFRFNENNLKDINQIAVDNEFDCWQLTKSTKFGSKYPDAYGNDDLLEPLDKTLIASGLRYEREQKYITTKTRPGADLKEIFWERAKQLQNSKEYPALCYIGNKGVFLKATGEFYPCCWVANRYPHNKQIIELAETKFNLHNTTIENIINDSYWTNEFKAFDYHQCKAKCTKAKLHDKPHVTEW